MLRVSNTEVVVTDRKLTGRAARRQFGCQPLSVALALLLFVDCVGAWADETGDAPASRAATNEPTTNEPTQSDYSETVPAAGGSSSVGAELIDDDQRKDPLFDVDFSNVLFPNFHERKKKFHQRTGIAFNTDYSLLAQRASFSFTERDAASQVFRVYGSWLATGRKFENSGNLVFKFEYRGSIWGDQTPRDLGFNTGSALSSANYNDTGWGVTDFYWKQLFRGDARDSLLVGHMDPGEWADQHILRNSWTNLINDAFYNNPTVAIPKRGFGVVGRAVLPRRWYVAAGFHDANGKGNELDFRQVWDTGEAFTWVEAGILRKEGAPFGRSTHLNYWHQDARNEAGTEASYGFAFSTSRKFDNGIIGVIRAGYSEGDAPQMRKFLGLATSFPMRGSDRLKVGIGWGSPPDNTLRSQTTVEILYRLQLTQNMTISPDLQVTFDPSFNEEKDIVYIPGLRFRYNF